jgi:hypothetical protein
MIWINARPPATDHGVEIGASRHVQALVRFRSRGAIAVSGEPEMMMQGSKVGFAELQ